MENTRKRKLKEQIFFVHRCWQVKMSKFHKDMVKGNLDYCRIIKYCTHISGWSYPTFKHAQDGGAAVAIIWPVPSLEPGLSTLKLGLVTTRCTVLGLHFRAGPLGSFDSTSTIQQPFTQFPMCCTASDRCGGMTYVPISRVILLITVTATRHFFIRV